MTQRAAATAGEARHPRRARDRSRAVPVKSPQRAGAGLPRRRWLALLLASTIVSFLASSSVPTPLHALYAARWGFSPLAATVVFGVFALAVLASLLTFGELSDHLGRRPVLLAALAVQAVAMVLFATAGGLGTLLATRLVQGVATGALLAAAGAAMLDLDRRRGAPANSAAPGAGTAAGALLCALAVQGGAAANPADIAVRARRRPTYGWSEHPLDPSRSGTRETQDWKDFRHAHDRCLRRGGHVR